MSSNNPPLVVYSDGSIGYEGWDDETAMIVLGLDVLFKQEDNETREEFFKRSGVTPTPGEYGSDEELDYFVNGDGVDRIYAASNGYALKRLRSDTDERVRAEVVKNGVDLDYFMSDKSLLVKRALIEQEFRLNIFKEDPDPDIRSEVVKRGYYFDCLINDINMFVRAEVAKQGFGLNCLIKDEETYVRKEAVSIVEAEGGIEAWTSKHEDMLFEEKAFKHSYDIDELLTHSRIDTVIDIIEDYPHGLTGELISKLLSHNSIKTRFAVEIIEITLNKYGCDGLFEYYDAAHDNGEFLYASIAGEGRQVLDIFDDYKCSKDFFKDRESIDALTNFMESHGDIFFGNSDVGWRIYRELGIGLVSS